MCVESGFFFKFNKRDSTFIRELRVPLVNKLSSKKNLEILADMQQNTSTKLLNPGVKKCYFFYA